MITNLILFLVMVFGPMAVGALLWALGNPAKRLRFQFRLSTLLITMVPLGVIFALFRYVPLLDAWTRNIYLLMLSRVLPLLLLSGWLVYNCVEEFRHHASDNRKLPEDLPNDLFEGESNLTSGDELDKDATREFNDSFRGGIRKRFPPVLERMNAFFNIQKRY